MPVIGRGNGFTISSSFGNEAVEGTVASGSQGAGRNLTFTIEQSPVQIRTVYVQVVPVVGNTGDFWDDFWSNNVNGSPADQFALSSFVPVTPSGQITVTLNADNFAEPDQVFEVRIYESVTDSGFGVPPLFSSSFTVLDDDIQGTSANDMLRGRSHAEQFFGFGGNDTLIGGGGNDDLNGGNGADRLWGGSGNDFLNGGNGADRLDGSAGNDTLRGSLGNDLLSGGANNDRLYGDGGKDTLTGGNGLDTLDGGSGNDKLSGNGGNDVLLGEGGNDTLVGGGGNDDLNGGNGADKLDGNAGNDKLYGEGGRDTLNGGNGLDTLAGGAGTDSLSGNGGNDVLFGGGGNDFLVGGRGKDLLTGRAGADHFIFLSANETTPTPKGRDVIRDFNRSQGDKIDLSAIDANLDIRGDQAFTFIGKDGFSGSDGELRYYERNDVTFLQADLNGDYKADFAIELSGTYNLGEQDFLL